MWTNAAILISGDERWKAKGANSNIRGAGTSERTFYRRKQQKRFMEDDAARSYSMLKYYIGIHNKAITGDKQAADADVEDDVHSVGSVDSLSEHVLLGNLEARESAYRLGMEGPLLGYAIRKYKSQRRIPEMLYDRIREEYEKWAAAKERRKSN